MTDIFLDLPIRAPLTDVFDGVSTPAGLDEWWTKGSTGTPESGAEYELDFGPGYQWKGRVTACTPEAEFELELTEADADWTGTRIGFHLEARDGATWMRFHHKGWPERNEHYRVSCNCWAAYLRILRRHLEYGERVPYEQRLDA